MPEKNAEKAKRQTSRRQNPQKNILGNIERVRLSVYRSKKGICVQVIDDKTRKTLALASGPKKVYRGILSEISEKSQSFKLVGELVAETVKQVSVLPDIPPLHCDRVKVLAAQKASSPSKKGKGSGNAKRNPASVLLKYAGKAAGLPSDASRNHDHYLYGTPKR
jgi:ribosomal protein L18